MPDLNQDPRPLDPHADGVTASGVYNASPPSAVSGQPIALQTDNAGNLKVAVVAGGGGAQTVTQATGANLHTVVDSGAVAVTSLPPLPAGTNALGSVSVSNLPASQRVTSQDGDLATIGTTTDAAYTGTGATTLLGGVKGIALALLGGIGSPTDAAWTSGAGSLIALGKATVGAVKGALNIRPLTSSDVVTVANPTTSVAVSGAVSVSNLPSTQAISAVSLPLPSGAAQDSTLTGGSQVAVLKTAAKGTTSAAQPTSTAVDANTQALHASVTNFPATQAVSGTVAVSALPALPAGSNAIGTVTIANPTTSVSVSNFPATQTVAGTVAVSSLPALPAGSNTIGAVTITGTPSVTAAVTGSVAVTNLPATQAVSGTVTANAGTGTMAVSAAALPLPAGAAQDTTVAGVTTALGHLTDGTALARLTDGTTTANVLPGSGTATGQAALQVAGTFLEKASLSAGSLNADLLASTDVSGYKWFSVQVQGTYSGTLTFQGSNDNTNWVSVSAMSVNSVTSPATVSTSSSGGLYAGPLHVRYLRVRMTSYTSGTATGTVELYTTAPPALATGSSAAQNGTWTTRISDGTNTANVTAATSASNAMTAQGAQLIAGAAAEYASLSAGALNADLLPSTDVTQYRSIAVQTAGTWSGAITFQGSNDGVTWFSIVLQNLTATTGAGTTGTSGNNMFYGPLNCRYIRIRMTAYTSGTATGTVELYTQTTALMTQSILASQTGTWTAVPNAATSGGSTPYHLVSAATTNAQSVKTSAGQVYGLSLSNGSASARYVKLFNKASAPTVGTDVPVRTILVPAGQTVVQSFPVGLAFATGIALATTGALADADTTAIGAGDLSIDIDYK